MFTAGTAHIGTLELPVGTFQLLMFLDILFGWPVGGIAVCHPQGAENIYSIPVGIGFASTLPSPVPLDCFQHKLPEVKIHLESRINLATMIQRLDAIAMASWKY